MFVVGWGGGGGGGGGDGGVGLEGGTELGCVEWRLVGKVLVHWI